MKVSVPLPAELILYVFELVEDRRTLYTLFYLSPHFYSHIVPLFYSHLVIYRLPPLEPRFKALLHGLEENANRIGHHVKRLTMYCDEDETTFKVVNRVLPTFTNLKSLKYDQRWTRYRFDPPVLCGNELPHPFQLTHFRWMSEELEAEAFAAFLASQPSLELLETSTPSGIPLPPGALPNLQTLIAPIRFSLSILASARPTHLKMRENREYAFTVIETIPSAAHGLAAIQTCSIFGNRLPLILQLVSGMPNLRCLDIGTPRVGVLLDL
ncbi:hypothetical protein ONZ45_g16706 [Pleurotus djamor]|nr:hypothetical protein ONZ45_g16706 [Pleurotus djamor]